MIVLPPKRRIMSFIVYGVILISIVIGLISIWWTVEDPHMLDVHNATSSTPEENGTVFSGIPLRPGQVKPGELVFMHLDYCKLKNIDGHVIARLVGQKFTLRLTWPDDQTKTGCVNSEAPIPIPDIANDDTYYVEFEVLYHVNPIKDRDVILRSVTFKVNQ